MQSETYLVFCAYMPPYIRTHIHTHILTYIDTHMPMHMYVHIRMPICDMYVHMYMYNILVYMGLIYVGLHRCISFVVFLACRDMLDARQLYTYARINMQT